MLTLGIYTNLQKEFYFFYINPQIFLFYFSFIKNRKVKIINFYKFFKIFLDKTYLKLYIAK
ncbi:hypothetical protein AMJ80_00920 [bacterium SM23_31]|nr:MAG: hypothetical protein AMJ80_00920 [bacterium SM23_31]